MGIGALLAFYYDLLRVLRKVFSHQDWLVHVEDFLFWSISAFILFFVLLYNSSGEIRGFSFLGVLLGALLYLLLLSMWIRKLLTAFIMVIKKIVRGVVVVIGYPFYFLFGKLSKPFRLTGRMLKRKGRVIGSIGKIKAKKTIKEWKIMFKKI